MLKRLGRSEAVRKAIGRAIAGYLWLVMVTTRWRMEGAEQIEAAALRGNALVGFWHEQLLLMPQLYRVSRSYNPAFKVTALASRHRDGQLLGDILGALGIGTTHGSSAADGRERGGASAARALFELMGRGETAAITPDGPRGPRRRAKRGVAQLAGRSGLGLIPCGVQVRWHVRLGSWDRLIVPFPFGRGAMVCLPPISVPAEGWEASLAAIEAGMTAAADRAEALCR